MTDKAFSYAALALLQYDALYGSRPYRNTAITLMDWVLNACGDDTPGYSAGFDGWDEGGKPTVYPLTYQSVDHNIDAYAAFCRLAALTGEEKYQTAAESRLAFIHNMYDADKAYFCTGTENDGVTPNKGSVVLDGFVRSNERTAFFRRPPYPICPQASTCSPGSAGRMAGTRISRSRPGS